MPRKRIKREAPRLAGSRRNPPRGVKAERDEEKPVGPMGLLGKLPAELRNQVYEETLIHPDPIDVARLNPVGGLLCASHALHAESAHIFWQNNTFVFHIHARTPGRAVDWPRRIGDVHSADVKTVQLMIDTHHDVNVWNAVTAALAERCKGITTVQIGSIYWSPVVTARRVRLGLVEHALDSVLTTWWPLNHRSVWQALESFDNVTVVDLLGHGDNRWIRKFRELHPTINLRLCSSDGEVLEDSPE